MIESKHNESKMGGLSVEAADLFARGLYYVANVDGVEAREEALLREFIDEAGCTLRYEELAAASFSMHEAAMMLESTFQRRMFVTAAIAMIKADGDFSSQERQVLGEIADVFGLSNADFGHLEQEASRASL